jgi:soluble lytic murein transglycosylase
MQSRGTFWRCVRACAASWALAGASILGVAQPVTSGDALLLDAREALRRGDRSKLATLRQALVQEAHPLAGWADYWGLSGRLTQASAEEVEAFYQRWPGSYVEDRLRNDWLLELGRRRHWDGIARELPRFRMADDREVHCYGLWQQWRAGREVKDAAVAAWLAQRDADEGCQGLAADLRANGQLATADVWYRLRTTVEAGRLRGARAAAALLTPAVAKSLEALWDNPARYLARQRAQDGEHAPLLGVLAVIRLAAADPEVAATQFDAPWARTLRPEWAAVGWGAIARQAALRQLPEAAGWGERALQAQGRVAGARGLGDDTLAWIARGQLRATSTDRAAWALLAQAVDTMSAESRDDPVWVYWKARALLARARPGTAGDTATEEAQAMLARIVSPLHFYGLLAAEQLGQIPVLPAAPAAVSAAEAEESLKHAGLSRALQLMAIGLRSEGVREWNFSLIGMDDRQLLAAAQRACSAQVHDRCIHTSERARREIDLAQRYPLPFQPQIQAAATQAGLDPALVLGLIRQESRFVGDARSHVGASGLMQVMPATARWTARKIGLEWRPEWAQDREINLRLGTAYLRMVLDDFGGSLPMAMSAYNAGPNRPRRWREGAILEPAAWAETIPIHETRDYVKKVLANAAVYAVRLGTSPAPVIKPWLGKPVGPREPDGPEQNKELP